MAAAQAPDAYPSIAWVIVPLLLVPMGFFVRARLAARKLARTGIGRGAPGFQTSVRRIAVTPDIAARLRRGEEVSPEEIAAAQAAAAALAETSTDVPVAQESRVPVDGEENEWLPEELKRGSSKGETKSKRGKKRR